MSSGLPEYNEFDLESVIPQFHVSTAQYADVQKYTSVGVRNMQIVDACYQQVCDCIILM